MLVYKDIFKEVKDDRIKQTLNELKSQVKEIAVSKDKEHIYITLCIER
jgi:hypothetical protein